MALPPPDPSHAVLVTGASSGIGHEVASELARRGHGLVVTARRRERLDALAEELRARHGVQVAVHPADLADAGSRAGLVAAVREDARFVAGLVNDAGFGALGRFDLVDPEVANAMVAVNVVAVHELCEAFVRPMVARRQGAILNLSSIAGLAPQPGSATYAATKAFVGSLSEALHAELAGSGVSCTAVYPGPVPTEFNERAGAEDADSAKLGPLAVAPGEVARQAVEAMEQGRRTLVPGTATKAVAVGARLAPRTLVLAGSRLALGRRIRRPSPKVGA